MMAFCYLRRYAGSHMFSARKHVEARRNVASFSPSLFDYGDRGDSRSALLLGCVCYDPSVGEIWSGIQKSLREKNGVHFDFVMFPTYDSQVRALMNSRIDIAWNGPTAHVMCEALAAETDTLVSLGMRDVDRDFKSVLVVRKDSGIRSFEDLDNQRFVTGASDSPQAHIVPLHYLFAKSANVKPASVTVMDLDLGKHGDTASGEVEALKSLCSSKTHDVAIVSEMMWDRAKGGLLSLDSDLVLDSCMVLDSVKIHPFDHCQFDALLSSNNEDDLARFGEAILEMDMQDPIQGPLMKLEGIANRWVGPRQTGYDIVRQAMGVSSTHRPAANFQYRSVREFSVRSAPSDKRIGVIGAGVAGLQAIRALQGRGLPVTAFEGSSSVGGVWNKNYANFGLQVPKQLYEFQDFPMRSVKRGEYPTGQQVQSYIEDYASAFGLYDAIQFQSRVVSATRIPGDDGSKWRLVIEKNGNESTQEFDFLVAAGGLYSGLNKRLLATFGIRERFQGTIVHSCDFTDASTARNRRVVVVGGGKSAVDCAVEAARAGATSVTMVQREAHWPTPRRIAGLIPFQYVFLSRFGTALVSAHQGTFPGGSGPVVNAFRDSVGRYLVKPIFRAVEELFAIQFGLRGDLRPKADIVADFYDVALVLDSGLQKLRNADGAVKVTVAEIQGVKPDGKTLLLSDGSSIESDLIVTATGYEHRFDLFDNRTREDLEVQSDGIYLHRYILPEKVPDLAFIGYVATISNISTYGLQAEWLARCLTGDLLSGATPNHEDIKKRKTWARAWMPHTSKRGMLVLLHQTHYHDQLLRDMGVSPLRKGALAEYIMPYESADYNGIMGGPPTHR